MREWINRRRNSRDDTSQQLPQDMTGQHRVISGTATTNGMAEFQRRAMDMNKRRQQLCLNA